MSSCKSYSHFLLKKFQHICVSLDVNFNESLTNDVVSFEQLGPDDLHLTLKSPFKIVADSIQVFVLVFLRKKGLTLFGLRVKIGSHYFCVICLNIKTLY